MAAERKNWPTHPDGRPKKIGEMTADERRAQFTAAAASVGEQLARPASQRALQEYLDGTTDTQTKH